jgi:hypothetical protein
MKITIAYVIFLFSLTNLILGLPELAAKVQNWLPILTTSNDLLDGLIEQVVILLPSLPDCTFCLRRLVLLPEGLIFGLIIMGATFWGTLILNMAINAKPGKKLRFWAANARPVIWSPVIGLILVILVVSVWLTVRYSERSLGLFELLWALIYVPAAPVKNTSIFLHTLVAYSLVITIIYTLVLTIASGSWIFFVKYIYRSDH